MPIEPIPFGDRIADAVVSSLPVIVTILLTAFIISVAAYSTYKSNKKSSELARQSEHENKISEFRHHWLQEVREEASGLLEILYEIHMLNYQFSLDIEKQNDDTLAHNRSLFTTRAIHSFDRVRERRAIYYRRSSKLKLLFKEGDAPELIKVLNDYESIIYGTDDIEPAHEFIDEIVSVLRQILKEEWDVTKNRTWSNGTS